ncbi:MAG: hypothetical protein E7532_07050 [Ruminococcaceae bacterium]|nr:hypothetical protein [Oscillospiraceae bacterium]
MKLIKKCLCLFLVLTTLMSVVSFGSIVHTHAASASSYISETYASNLSVKTTTVANLYDVPSASGTLKYSVAKDTLLSVKALHKNTAGEYWYQVSYYKLTLYVNGADTTMVSHLTGDVTAKNLQSPAALQYGSGFPIGGEITSVLNDIGEVRASLYKSSDLTREPALTSADTVNGKYYNLTSSTVDTNLWFNLLSTGVYTYVVSAEAISYYVDDSDNLAESSIDVFVENKQCIVTDKSNPNPVLHNGIDVSVWNGDIDWPTVANQVDFVIIRASWEETADTKFATNAQGCENNGIPYGVYVYSYAETEAEAIGEAEYVLSLVENYDLSLPIYFDFEDECQMSLDSSLQKKIVKAFCDTIYAGGRQPGIYTYKWVLTSVLTDAYFKTLPTWVAEINGASYTSYAGGLTMWQYSWTGSFSGMSGDVDCNYLYGELPGTKSSDTSYLNQCEYYPSNLSVTLNANVNVREYPASTYTLLDTLSSGTKLHVTGLYKNTYGNYWYQIEHDGKSGYIASEYANVDEYLFDDISIQNPDMASNLNSGSGYYIRGDLSSIYNNLTTVNAKVYSGEDTSATPVLNSSFSPDSKFYSLYKSEVDYGLLFGTQNSGYYTYEISADVKNYSASGTTLSSKTENVVVWTSPYTVNNASVTPPESAACTHNIVTQPAVEPTCTTKGLTEGSYCSLCSVVFATQTEIDPKGHNYQAKFVPATCKDFEYTIFTCLTCGDSYKESQNIGYSDWSETKPEGIDESLIETKTQYSYSEYQTIKNYETSVDGYTLINKEWESQGQKTQECVKSWDSGFDQTHSLYSQYNKTPAKDYTDTYYNKQELNSESIVGYIYYHWCSDQYHDGPYNRTTSKTKTDYYVGFHAFYSTKSPSESEREASDGSVIYSNLSCCGDSYWYYNIPVYKQTYTDYKALYTHSIWTAYSDWSDTEYTESWDRKVKTRTLYRYVNEGYLGEHNYVNGVCSVCGEAQPAQDMYLFGYINGADYGDKDDYLNLGAYCFEDGKLVATFKENSYVGVKTADNLNWYMTNGYLGEDVTAAMLYHTSVLGDNADKLFVPKGREITFTLEKNDNNTYTLSYVAAPCNHERHNTQGECVDCGETVNHHYSYGGCTVCGATCPHSYISGVCRLCSLACSHNEYENGACKECGIPCEHSFENGTCTICTLKCEHNFRNGICSVCGSNCDHQWSNGSCTLCSAVCLPHNYSEGVCIICSKPEPKYYLAGYINGEDNSADEYIFTNGTLNAKFIEDSYVYVRSSEDKAYMTSGYLGENATMVLLYDKEILGADADKLFVPKGRNITFTLTDNGDDTLMLVYTADACQHTNHNTQGICSDCSKEVGHSFTSEGVCSVCSAKCNHTFTNSVCTTCGYKCNHSYTDGVCTICGAECKHNFIDGVCKVCQLICAHSYEDGKCSGCGTVCKHNISSGICTVCSKTFTYSLAGVINGSFSGCESDFESCSNVFTDMKATLETTEDSFVFVKTTDNEFLYLAKDTSKSGTATLYNSATPDAEEMLYVPSGVKAEFTLSFGENDTLILSYEIMECAHLNRNNGGICRVCGDVEPVAQVDLKYAELAFEEKVKYTVYFDTLNIDGVSAENMGIMMFDSLDYDANADTASKIYSGVRSENGYFAIDTDPMYAHKLGDEIYFKAFAKLADGSYVYSDIMSYSGVRYATSVINNPNCTKEHKALMVALLNYGAELQKYYDYNTDKLMNAELTDKQRALVKDYSPSMAQKTTPVSKAKAGEFAKSGKGVVFYPTLKFDTELFGFELTLKARGAEGNAHLYYWEEDTFSNADVLTKDNAAGPVAFNNIDGQYNLVLYDAYAKDLDSSLYVAMVYETQDGTYSSGVISISIADLFKAYANNESSEYHELSKAAVVYGYYAKNFFKK